jgi:hypothetical protein
MLDENCAKHTKLAAKIQAHTTSTEFRAAFLSIKTSAAAWLLLINRAICRAV